MATNKNNGRVRPKALTDGQRNIVLSKAAEVAKDKSATDIHRLIACLIGLLLTTGLRLVEILSLRVDSLERSYCEEIKKNGYFFKIPAKDGTTVRDFCGDIAAMFFNTALSIHNADERIIHDNHLFVMYSPHTNNPRWITVVSFEHYHETFYEKYLRDFKDEEGEKFVPTVHQYRQTYMNALYELQRKKYREESGMTEAELDAFEKEIFKQYNG